MKSNEYFEYEWVIAPNGELGYGLSGKKLFLPSYYYQQPIKILKMIDFVFSLAISEEHLRKNLALDIFIAINPHFTVKNPDDFLFFDMIYSYYQNLPKIMAHQLFTDIFDIIKAKYTQKLSQNNYFNIVPPFDHHTNIPNNTGFNPYSFALRPDDDYQPSGNLNRSYTSNVYFYF